MSSNEEFDNPLLSDWTTYRVILGTILITLGATGAAGGGIGGGGLYVPMLIIVIGFETKEAIAISQGCIVGAAMAHLILNAPKKHPLMDIPVIDYAALLVLEPMLLTGSIFGVMVNAMLPSIVLLLVLISVLSLGVHKTGKRALKITRSERKQNEELEARKLELAGVPLGDSDVDATVATVDLTVDVDVESSDVDVIVMESVGTVDQKDADTPKSVSGKEYIMWGKLGMVTGLWVIVCCGVIIRGSSAGEYSVAGVYYCSSGFWGLTAAIPVIEILFSVYFGKVEIDRNKLDINGSAWSLSSSKALLDYTEVEWNWPNVVRYMVYAFVCGALAGCLGIGGGLVLSPLLLELGFFPAVASGVSGMAVLVTSTSALFAYGLSDKVYWEFVFLLMPLTFVSTMAGKITIDSYAERNNKQSVIIWSVVIFLVVCLIMLTTRGLIELVDDPSYKFSSPCDS